MHFVSASIRERCKVETGCRVCAKHTVWAMGNIDIRTREAVGSLVVSWRASCKASDDRWLVKEDGWWDKPRLQMSRSSTLLVSRPGGEESSLSQQYGDACAQLCHCVPKCEAGIWNERSHVRIKRTEEQHTRLHCQSISFWWFCQSVFQPRPWREWNFL